MVGALTSAAARKKRTVDFRLYLITDRKQLVKQSRLISAVMKALKGGVKAVQLREKDVATRELLQLAYKLRAVTDRYDAKLFINDRYDIALAAGADGVHLTQSSIPADAVRRAVKNRLMIGVSAHSLKEAKDAEKGGADFITLGPVFRTPSKVKYGAPLGLEKFRTISSKVNIPVFGLGGIKAGRIRAVRGAGAHGVAMISEVFGADNVQDKAKELTGILNSGV